MPNAALAGAVTSFTVDLLYAYSSAAVVDAHGVANSPGAISFGDCLRVNEVVRYDVSADFGDGAGFQPLETDYVRNYYWLRQGRGIIALTVLTATLAWLLFVGLPRWYGPQPHATVAAKAPAAPATPGRKIKARLYYVADDGSTLVAVERDVPYGEGAVAQAKAIINAQLAPPAEPFVSAVPPGTTLRALFIAGGEAFVDLSGELMHGHPGGSLNEMLTVYTLVDSLTVNLPAVSAVQLLVDGREVETLAGHVDLRRPLAQNLAWVAQEAPVAENR